MPKLTPSHLEFPKVALPLEDLEFLARLRLVDPEAYADILDDAVQIVKGLERLDA